MSPAGKDVTEMDTEVKRSLKLWHGIVALIVSAVLIFIAAPYIFAPLGIWGSLLGEWLLVVVCIAVIRFAKADVRDIFPLKTPRVVNSIGVVMMWIGVMLLEMALLCVIAVFFPEQFFGVQSGMQDQFMGILDIHYFASKSRFFILLERTVSSLMGLVILFVTAQDRKSVV